MKRPETISLGSESLEIPTFFPSVSSVKTNLKPHEYINAILALSTEVKRFLISAYDVANVTEQEREKMQTLVRAARTRGMTVLLDSGNYEAYWKESNAWAPETFYQVLSKLEPSFAFGFDLQQIKRDNSRKKREILNQHSADVARSNGVPIVPIVHAKPNQLPQLCSDIAKTLGSSMIAVPERKLGEGIAKRVATIRRLRAALATEKSYIAIHVLGTGDPVSIALYAAAGADSFDGLEWCKTVVDHETGSLYHISQADFFKRQSRYSEIRDFNTRLLAHNLQFYSFWIERVRKALHEGTLPMLCRAQFTESIYLHCANLLHWKL